MKYPHMIREVRNDAACPKRLCAWSRSVVQHFRGDLGSTACRMQLRTTLVDGRDDQVLNEKGHGDVHRSVLTKNIQTKAADLASVNSFWANKQLRIDEAGFWPRKVHKAREKGKKKALKDEVEDAGIQLMKRDGGLENI